MTKFEEELNKIVVEVQTPLDKYIVEKATSDESLYAQHYEAVLEKFKDWHSDEDYQRAKRMVEHVQVENEMLKAKLKQQALPVVPEVSEHIHNWISKRKMWELMQDDYDPEIEELKELKEKLNLHDIEETIAWLKINEYTVEKPQQKRYEVKLLSGESMYFNPIGNPKNIKDYRFSFGNHAGWKTKFTKSELAEIKDGMFLKRIPGGTPLDDLGKDKSYYVWLDDCNYWINPLIELVPMEDGE